MNHIKDKCPICEGKIITFSKTINFIYKGHTSSFPNIEVAHCTDCKEEFITDSKQQKLIDKRLKKWRNQIDGI